MINTNSFGSVVTSCNYFICFFQTLTDGRYTTNTEFCICGLGVHRISGSQDQDHGIGIGGSEQGQYTAGMGEKTTPTGTGQVGLVRVSYDAHGW